MLTPAAVAPATGDALGIIIGVVLVILLVTKAKIYYSLPAYPLVLAAGASRCSPS